MFVTHLYRCARTRCLLSASDVVFILLHKIKSYILFLSITTKCFDLYILSSTNVFRESVGARCSDNFSWLGVCAVGMWTRVGVSSPAWGRPLVGGGPSLPVSSVRTQATQPSIAL